MAASAKTANATAGSHVQPAAGGGKPGHHHTHQTRALLQDMSWDADRAASARLRSFLAIKPSGLQGHVHTAATSLQGLAGQVSAWAGRPAAPLTASRTTLQAVRWGLARAAGGCMPLSMLKPQH